MMDLGDLPTLTAGFAPFTPGQPRPTADNPMPSKPGPRIDATLARLAPNATRAGLTAATTGTDELIAGSRAILARLAPNATRARCRALGQVS
ncbi:hypothetical protein [Micromonospora tarensis]|uniref:Uncharacterized protein n=1 Tax=Micromonospora tarensis TaxID=2806100 RepID=A0ABS1YJ94_9ACTN|nr:hypothetical protein [Micromonospora tarensis]MBM0277231.1 hypothetical protein [Micromonospora tarensis]